MAKPGGALSPAECVARRCGIAGSVYPVRDTREHSCRGGIRRVVHGKLVRMAGPRSSKLRREGDSGWPACDLSAVGAAPL